MIAKIILDDDKGVSIISNRMMIFPEIKRLINSLLNMYEFDIKHFKEVKNGAGSNS